MANDAFSLIAISRRTFQGCNANKFIKWPKYKQVLVNTHTHTNTTTKIMLKSVRECECVCVCVCVGVMLSSELRAQIRN